MPLPRNHRALKPDGTPQDGVTVRDLYLILEDIEGLHFAEEVDGEITLVVTHDRIYPPMMRNPDGKLSVAYLEE